MKTAYTNCKLLSRDGIEYLYFESLCKLVELPATFKSSYYLTDTIKKLKALGYKCKGKEFLCQRTGKPSYELKVLILE